MHIVALGLNHRTAPVALRERLALDGGGLPAALAAVRAEAREAAILATCNRTEVYAVTTHVDTGLRALRRVLATQVARGLTAEELEPYLYEHADAEAVRGNVGDDRQPHRRARRGARRAPRRARPALR